MKLDGFCIIKNEEEQITGMMECWWSIRDVLGTLSIVDNGSSDYTLLIVERFKKMGLPIIVTENRGTPNHGVLRTQAISLCKSPWILYLDAYETFTCDMLPWLQSEEAECADIIDFFKYSTIKDRYHYTEGGNGPSTRMFRNVPGVHFPQNIHTYPEAPAGLNRKFMASPLMFDHTGAKSREALWAKGARYIWATGTIGIGPIHEYIGRVDDAYGKNNVVEFSDDIKERIFTGPIGQWV